MWRFLLLRILISKNKKARLWRGGGAKRDLAINLLRPDGEASGPLAPVKLAVFPTLTDGNVSAGAKLSLVAYEDCNGCCKNTGGDRGSDEYFPLCLHLRPPKFEINF